MNRKTNDRHQTNRRFGLFWLILIPLVAFAIFRFAVVGTQPTMLVGGDEWLIDDFSITLTEQEWLESIDDDQGNPVGPSGRFLVVKVLIKNDAKRVEVKTNPNMFYIGSGDLPRIQVSQSAQKYVDPFGNEEASIEAGNVIIRKFVFDVPVGAEDLRLNVVFGGRLGEIADWLIAGKKYYRIALPESGKRNKRDD